jgi:N-sulfoglucosamine sulfohydrolase
MKPFNVQTAVRRIGLAAYIFGALLHHADAQQPAPIARPNVLMIVADDMNWNSPGSFGGSPENITPNIDRLANEGMRFWHAYVNVAVCTPSRSVMLTGLYPQRSGVAGFQQIRAGTPALPAILSQVGYLTGTVGKPLGQQETFRWSVTYRWEGAGDEDMWGRDPAVYRRFTKSFLDMAKASGQPFFLIANSHDSHRLSAVSTTPSA